MSRVIKFNDLDFGNTGKKIENLDIDMDQFDYVNSGGGTTTDSQIYLVSATQYMRVFLNNDTNKIVNYKRPATNTNKTNWQHGFKVFLHVFDFAEYINAGYDYMYILNNHFDPSTYDYNTAQYGAKDTNGLSFAFGKYGGTTNVGQLATKITDFYPYHRIIARKENVTADGGFYIELTETIFNIRNMYYSTITNGEPNGYRYFSLGCEAVDWHYYDSSVRSLYGEICDYTGVSIDKPIVKFIKEI